jgi:hypothetical protein
VVDHSSASRALKGTTPLTPRGLLIHTSADDESTTSTTTMLRKLMAIKCCNGEEYDTVLEICCEWGGQQQLHIKSNRLFSKCCGLKEYDSSTHKCCPGNIVKLIAETC